jgi:hypothetical protein
VVEREPRLITPGGNYYILAQSFEEEIKARFQDGDHWVPFEAYIAAENAKKYVVKAVLLVKMKAGQPQIHCQTTSISETDWRESTHSN